jgi:hypothetical protein
VIELTTVTSLQFTVPEGPHTGLHLATRTEHLKWLLKLGNAEYVLSYCAVEGLIITWGTEKVVAAIESHPFSATFSGRFLGIESDVVVTLP